MPRLQPLKHFLALTDNEAKMLDYLLESGAASEMPRRWAGHAKRLLHRMEQLDSVLRVLDVSTGHLTDAERLLLDCGDIPGQTHTGNYGGIISTDPYELVERGYLPDGASETLVAIMREAIRRGCLYVSFDADAGPLLGFPLLETEG